MRQIVVEKLRRAMQLYDDLIEFLPEDSLSLKLSNLPSNELGQQLWCVIGARNSYLNALKAGSWQGFECPLSWEGAKSKNEVAASLKSTAENANRFLCDASEFPEDILVDLLEHEVQHHGQIVRYLYGLKLGVPTSWKQRYNLD